jgi:predicted peptidase
MIPLFCATFCALTISQSASIEMTYQPKVFETDHGKLLCRYLTPETIENGEKNLLVIFLHGVGEQGDDNKKQLVHGFKEFTTPANQEKYPCFIIAPQCPNENKRVEVDWKRFTKSADTRN